MLNKLKVLDLKNLKNIKFKTPHTIQFDFMGSKLYFNFNQKSLSNLYALFGADLKFSEKIYNIDKDVWTVFFSFDKIEYEDYSIIINPEDLIILDFFPTDESFVNNYENIQIVNNTLKYNNENVFFILDLNTEKSIYSIYALQLNNNILYPTIGKLYSTHNLHSFLQYDIEADAKLYKLFPQTVDISDFYEYNTINVSLNELLQIIKLTKLKVKTNKNGLVECINEISDDILIDYINYFNLPYSTLKKLDKIQQVTMFESIKIEDLLKNLTKKCLKDSVSVEVLMYVYNIIKYSDYDKLKESGII